MTRVQFINDIHKESGYDKDVISELLTYFEDEIMYVIAIEDSIKLEFGTIEGFEKPSKKVTGFYALKHNDCTDSWGSWCAARGGYPKITWSSSAKYGRIITPPDYWARPDNRYTTKARQFRKDNNFPEILEYEGMSEEEIVAICEKADEEKLAPMTKDERDAYERNERHKKKNNEYAHDRAVREDLQKQRDAGVAEEDLVVRSPEEIIKEHMLEVREKYNSTDHWKISIEQYHARREENSRKRQKHQAKMIERRNMKKEEVKRKRLDSWGIPYEDYLNDTADISRYTWGTKSRDEKLGIKHHEDEIGMKEVSDDFPNIPNDEIQ